MAASHEYRSAAPRSSPDRGSPGPRDQNADCSQYPQSSTINLQIPSAENYPLQRVGEQQSKSLILSSFNQPPERGAHPGPLKPTEASSLGHSLPNRPRTLVLANGGGSADRVPFSPDSAPPDPPQTRARTDPLRPLNPFPVSPFFHPPQPRASLNATKASRADPSLLHRRRAPLHPLRGPSDRRPSFVPGRQLHIPRARRPGPRPLGGRHSPGKHTT